MSVESKNTLKAQNQSSFPNNTTGYITPEILRDFNVNIIDSLVDEISFGAYTASITAFSSSVDSRLDSLEAFSSSLDTTFATDAQLNASSSTLQSNINTKLDTASFNTFSSSVDSRLDSSLVTASVSQSTITFTKGDGSTFNITVADISGSGGTVNTGSLLLTASFDNGTRNLTFTKGDNTTFNVNIPDVSGSTIDTGSFATTGSNTFKGIETLQDDGGNTTAITPYSGSLLFVANTFASTSLNYITASTNKVNIILKDNNISGTFLLTGSGNIITNPNTASVGFISYLGNNNYSNASATQFSSSMTSLPSYNSNILNAGLVYFRGASTTTGTQIFTGNIVNNANLLFGNLAGTLTFDKAVAGYNVQSNIVNNTPIIAANVNNLASAFVFQRNFISNIPTIAMSSSAFTMNGNYLGSTGTYTNQYFSSSIGSGSLTFSRNIINGSTNNVTFTGSIPAGGAGNPQLGDSMMLGTNNTIFANVSAAELSGINPQAQVISTAVVGHNIIVSGSSHSAVNNFGGGFIGRYNDISGNKAKTSQTVFAVGTGNSTTRKTGFLIDSGSNTYVEGSLNVSGSTALTGSLIHSGSLSITGSGGIILTGSLQLTGSNLVINSAGTLIYNDKTIIQFYPSVNSNTESFSRFTKDGISLFQYQNQGHVFGFRYTADQLNEYSGSQFKTALTNDGVAYDDYVSYLSASISGSGGSIPGIQLTDGKAIYQTKTLLQKQRAYFDQDVIIAGQGVATSLKVTGSVNITGSLSVNGTSVGAQKNYASYYTTTQQSGSFLTSLTEEAVVGFQNVSGSYVRAVNGGVYQVTVNASINSTGTLGTSTISLYKTGSQITATTYGVYFTNAASDASITSTAIISLNANEYVEVGLGMVDTDKVTSARISVIQIS